MKFHQNIARFTLAMILLAAIATAVSAAVVPIRVDNVKIDDVDLQENASNRLDIQRGQEVEVEVKFTALTQVRNLQMEAFMSGFEYSDIAPLGSTTNVFDAEENVTYVRRVRVRISDEVEKDDYKLRIMFSDRFNQELLKDFNLKIDVPRHGFKVEDVVFFPNGPVEAGKGLLTTVRLENKGERDERDIRVQVSIPDLGVSGADYIDEVKHDREKSTEEIFIKIPENAKSGRYAVRVDVDFNQLHDHITAVREINVVGGSLGAGSGSSGSGSGSSGRDSRPLEPKTVITVNSQLESATPGKSGALFPITIINNDEGSRTYTLSADGGSWADVKITPSSTMIVDRGEAKLFSVYVTPKEGSAVGTQVVNVKVMSNGATLKEIPLTTNILAPEQSKPDVVRILEVVFIMLLVILVVVGLVIAFRHRDSAPQGAKEDSDSSMQTYY